MTQGLVDEVEARRVPFRPRSEDYSVPFRVAAARRMVYRNGLDSDVAGHVSVRVDDETMLVTGLQYFDETLPGDVALVAFDGTVISSDLPVSPAVAFHGAIYRARPDLGSVIHTHAAASIVLSSIDCHFRAYSVFAALFEGRVGKFVDVPGMSADQEAELIAEALGDHDVLLLQNHGMINAAATLELAAVEAILLEQSFRLQIEAMRSGGTPLSAEAVKAYQQAYGPNLRTRIWDANFRRLAVSDPDLFTVG